MAIYSKLTKIQSELKAPKSNYNSFGKYNYRSCEDILEAVKPILKKHDCSMVISDVIKQIGERYYIEVTATLYDNEDGTSVSNTAYAREADEKKGMDASQLTGATSTYARKYCLNGLFLIDDTKDADTDEFFNQTNKPLTKTEVKTLENLCAKKGKDPKKLFKVPVAELTSEQYTEAVKRLSELPDAS